MCTHFSKTTRIRVFLAVSGHSSDSLCSAIPVVLTVHSENGLATFRTPKPTVGGLERCLRVAYPATSSIFPANRFRAAPE
jgi:hypothetical protein